MEGVTSAGNGLTGVRLFEAASSLLSAITAVNNGGDGVSLNAADATLLTAIAANNNGAGISLLGSVTVVDAAAVSNGGVGVRLNFLSTAFFSGSLKVGGNSGGDCWSGSGTSGLLNNCGNEGTSDALLSTGVNVAASLVGKVITDDPQNSSDTSGTAAFDTLTDWTHFAAPLRGWGVDGNAFPDAGNRGRCVSGATCRIWDWNLAGGDSVLRTALSHPTGNDILKHRWTPSSQSACQTVIGAAWDSAAGRCTSTFLRHAREIFGIRGNDNALCESGETCLYAPNIGAYQGHGSLVSAGTFTAGTLSGIELLRYDRNGY
jgi:hypothetical protein